MRWTEKISVDEHHLENKTLSLKAKGLFSLMLDKTKKHQTGILSSEI